MTTQTRESKSAPFETIQLDIVKRLDREAEARTLRPQAVDWDEIHRQAEVAIKK